MTRAVLPLALCSALTLGACSGAGPTTTNGPSGHPRAGGGGDSAPARDTFTGAIVSGTGAYLGHHGPVTVYLHVKGSGQSRSARVVIRGRCGDSSQNCTDLQGTVSGRLIPMGPRVPDVGHGFNLSGAGQVGPLGHVILRGGVEGTGFISHGHELIKITLATGSGSVTVVARSGPVKGFTSP